MEGAAYLRQQGFSDELVQAILAHADHAGVVRDTLLKKAIYAVDELTGLIIAAALVRPSKKLAEVEVKSVMKKWKEKSFAAGVNRQAVEQGARELGVPLEEHVGIVLKAMQGISAQLGSLIAEKVPQTRPTRPSSAAAGRLQSHPGGSADLIPEACPGAPSSPATWPGTPPRRRESAGR